MAVYGSVKLVTEDGYSSVWQCEACYKEWFDSVWQCKVSYRGLLWQCMTVYGWLYRMDMAV